MIDRAEIGIVAAKGVAKFAVLRQSVEKARDVLREPVLAMAELLFAQIEAVDKENAKLDRRIKKQIDQSPEMDRLMTIPGVGPLSAMAVHALAPSMEVFGSGRDFAAWVGLTPRQHSTAGKSQLGRITKIVEKRKGVKGFEVLPRGWLVERTFAWMSRCRRLGKDYERSLESSLAWAQLAASRFMMCRLARSNTT